MSQWQTAGKVRMTPKGIWSASTAYVVLDCVSNTDKTAYYVAKQNVPAGTLLTNTEYWEVVNDISDIVSQLTNEIERLEDIVALGYPAVSGTGKFMNAEGTIDAPLSELTIYGKSVQSDATPTPSVPVDIVTAGDSGTLVMVGAGKNLAYMTRGSIDYTTGAEEVSNQATRTGFIPVMGPRLYCTKSTAFASGSAYSLNARCYAADQSYIGTVRLMDGEILESYVTLQYNTTLNQAAYIRFVQFYPDSTTTPEDINLMIAFGDTSSVSYPEYVRASSISSAIPTPNGLPGIPVTSGGNYTDTDGQMWICDTIDLEAGTWTKRVETYTVTGSESISKSSESAVDTYLLYFPTGTPDLVKGNTTFLCSHFRASGTTAVGNAEIPTTGNYLRMRCHYASAGTSTVETFTAAITGMTVVYALAAPVVTQLTQAQLTALRALRGRKGLTNLYSADSAGPEFRAEMYIDIPTYINSLVN